MVSGPPPRTTLSLRGRGGGRGRGRDGAESSALEEPASEGVGFKLGAAIEFLSSKYQTAWDSEDKVVYKSKSPAWGANAPMLDSTSPEAFLKMLSSALAAYDSLKG